MKLLNQSIFTMKNYQTFSAKSMNIDYSHLPNQKDDIHSPPTHDNRTPLSSYSRSYSQPPLISHYTHKYTHI
jgi:hypothetical protein